MKKIPIIALACMLIAAVANANNATTVKAFVQPFDKSYALDGTYYLWYTDIDLTNPTGSYCGVWEEIDRLHALFPGYDFSPTHYSGLLEFEYGFCSPWYYQTIYSDLSR